MAVIFGDVVEPNKVKVMSIAYLTDDASNGGYRVNKDDIPEYPAPIKGQNHVMFFKPETSEFIFEQVERELTESEKMDDIQTALDTLILDALMGGN